METTIKAGAMIRNRSRETHVGTLTCLVRARSDPSMLYILGCAHVIGLNGLADPGDIIEAHDPASGQWIAIGRYERSHKWRNASTGFQDCDAALATIIRPGVVLQEIDGIGPIGPVSTRLYQGMQLKFRGAGTGTVGTGVLLASGTGARALYEDIETGNLFELEYANQILYVKPGGGVPASPTTKGDSGALVVTADNEVIGMHFARTPDHYIVDAAVCTPMETILSALDVEMVPADMGVAFESLASASAPQPSLGAQPVHADLPTPDGQFAATEAEGDTAWETIPPPAAGGQQRPFTRIATLDEVNERSFETYRLRMRSLLVPHREFPGAYWYLGPDGLVVDNKLDRSGGKMVTVPFVWQQFGPIILAAAAKWEVPVELIVATICTESVGNARALRIENGYVSDSQTPMKISAGLMQTLIGTAREALVDPSITRQHLFEPEVSINAGTAYIARQKGKTDFDPPKVACAYNAGGVYMNDGEGNRWKMRQYPLYSGKHADRFAEWFNDCVAFLLEDPARLPSGTVSFIQLLRR